jgi:tetratricopeptide (TPR) repeat protein
MKHGLYILYLVLSLHAFSSVDLTQQAETFYKNKNYKGAIESYEMIVKQGVTSYKLFYNLGNAYYKNNEIGKAIYNYELANKLKPNNDDIKTNLRIANQKTIDKIESKENFFLGAIKTGLVNYFTTTGWALLSIGSLTACLVLAFLFFVLGSMSIKRLSFFTSGLCLIAFIGSMVLGFSALHSKQQISFAIITTRESKIFEEPNPASKSKFSLHDGTKVSVIETNQNWTNIKLENGNEGWVKTTDIGLF